MALDPAALLACTACPRLAAFLAEARAAHPGYHARPVPPSGDPNARILYVGLAPGFHGANRTGRPFTGDTSGTWLTESLAARSQDAAITNAVKCCPPRNKPTAAEVRTCRDRWLAEELGAAHVIVALGAIAFHSVAGAKVPFTHGAEVPVGRATVLGCYHPSPLNTRTGRMSRAMFEAVLDRAEALAGKM